MRAALFLWLSPVLCLAQEASSLPTSAPASAPIIEVAPLQPKPTIAAEKRSTFVIDGQIFTGYQAASVSGELRNEFTLERGEVGARYEFRERGGFNFRLESIRSGGGDSFFGVDGDSLVLRVKRAFGYAAIPVGPGVLSGQAGLIADPWLGLMERENEVRPLGQLLAERGRFFVPGDLGASISYSVFEERASFQYTVTNGEGLQQTEQNTGKNSTFLLSITPLRTQRVQASLHAGYRDGSLGVAFIPNHRTMAGFTLGSAKAKAGGEFILANGYEGLGDKKARGVSAWMSATPYLKWLGVLARFDSLQPDTSLVDASQTRIIAGIFADVLTQDRQALRLHLAYQGERFGANAASLPGGSQLLNSDGLLVVLSMQGARQF
jgi:hypothetical protein